MQGGRSRDAAATAPCAGDARPPAPSLGPWTTTRPTARNSPARGAARDAVPTPARRPARICRRQDPAAARISTPRRRPPTRTMRRGCRKSPTRPARPCRKARWRSAMPRSNTRCAMPRPRPGVYRMLNAANDVLYVGKAKNVRKRLSSYARIAAAQPARIMRMIAATVTVEIISTCDRDRGAAARGQPDQAVASRASTCNCATTSRFPIS